MDKKQYESVLVEVIKLDASVVTDNSLDDGSEGTEPEVNNPA